MTRSLVVISVLALALGCAHARVDDPPLAMELTATGLKEDERALLRDQICVLEGISECAMEPMPSKGKGKSTTTVRFLFRGSLGNLRHRIAQLPHPGLEPKAAQARLEYEGFDNLAPSIAALEPPAGKVLTYKRVVFRVDVPDKDTAEVVIGEKKALQEDGAWQSVLELLEGENRVRVLAKDDVGNERELFLPVVIDTTPPALEVQVTPQPNDLALVEGQVDDAASVEVDGQPVGLDLFKKFRLEVKSDPDKRSVTIVARDEHGNEVRQRRSLKDGRVLD